VFTDAFVTKLNPSGTALVYSTFLGGSNDDDGQGIAVDSVGDAYVTGFTRSSNFPVAGAAQQTFGGGACAQPGQPQVPCSDVFITELNPSGSALVVSTFFGGSNEDEGHGIAVDAVGYPYVTGFTRSTNFPTRTPFQAQYGDPAGNSVSDAFITKLIEPPVINPGGTVNAASLAAGGAVSPGSIVSVFGTKFAPLAFATAVPLPTTLAGVALRFNTTLAVPLFFTSAAQINFQIPWELEGQTSASITATASGLTSDPVTVPLATYAPGIFSTTASGRGQGAILIAATGEVAAPTGSIPGRATRPARPGEFLTIFCTGLGPVSNRPASGAIAPTSPPLATTTATPTVTIGGEGATVSFSGLAPGFVGLYQINVPVPVTARAGNEVPVILSIGGATSNTVTIAVQ
jgi:uncharacterized protein (TIGR03437 family)